MSIQKRMFSLLSYVVIVSLTLLFSKPVLGAPPLANNDAITLIEQGMNMGYVDIIPIGDIVISKAFDAIQNPQKHMYTGKFGNTLLGYNRAGFILVDDTTDKMTSKAVMGESTYKVTITEKGKKSALGTNEQGDYIFRYANVKITKIVKNSEFTPAFGYYPPGLLDRSADYRLVLGTYDLKYSDTQNEIFIAIGAKVPREEKSKFKALLKYDPFNNKYKYIQKDWGRIDKDDWVTNTIK